MTKILKALRVKQDVLRQNILYMRAKRAAQHWHQRTEITLMLRRRNEQVMLQWRHKQMRRVLNGWKAIDKEESINLSRMNKLVQRMRDFDLAAAFQKWQQWTMAENEKDK